MLCPPNEGENARLSVTCPFGSRLKRDEKRMARWEYRGGIQLITTDNTAPKWVTGVIDTDINYERGKQGERRSTVVLKEGTFLK